MTNPNHYHEQAARHRRLAVVLLANGQTGPARHQRALYHQTARTARLMDAGRSPAPCGACDGAGCCDCVGAYDAHAERTARNGSIA